jgi:alpha-maltose-1-phosphate synthase
MKVLLLTNEYPPHIYGGAGVHVEFLSRELAHWLEVEVRCFGDQHLDQAQLAVRGYQGDEQAISAPRELRPLFTTLQRDVAMAATDVDAQIAHCHTWYSHLAGLLIKQAYEIPMVVTVHSLEPLRPWKREQLKGGYDVSSWLERTALQMADAVIAVSSGTRDDVLRLFDLPPERVRVIHNGIDLGLFRPVESVESLRRHGVDPDRPYVLFVGRITRQKGIIHLVQAIADIDPAAQIVLCAGAPDTPAIAAEMQAAVEEVQAKRSSVIWIREMLPREELVELYSHATVFCCPSIYEPFGIINLEAMACGTAVVASAVGGIPEVVVDGRTGLLVPLEQHDQAPFEPQDPARYSADLAAAINRLLHDQELRSLLVRAGLEWVRSRFSWRTIAEQTAELYQELVR